jgi:hypothetical protein
MITQLLGQRPSLLFVRWFEGRKWKNKNKRLKYFVIFIAGYTKKCSQMYWRFGVPGTKNFMILNFRAMSEFQTKKMFSKSRVRSSGSYNFELRYLFRKRRFGELKALNFVLYSLNQINTLFTFYINKKAVHLTQTFCSSFRAVFVRQKIISLLLFSEIRLLIPWGKNPIFLHAS